MKIVEIYFLASGLFESKVIAFLFDVKSNKRAIGVCNPKDIFLIIKVLNVNVGRKTMRREKGMSWKKRKTSFECFTRKLTLKIGKFFKWL